MHLLDLPDCMLEEIFEFLSYDEIARKRLINRKINKICQSLLNRGFSKMIRRHTSILKRIKSLLPRRESERRTHPMARHADILTCVETRISMLSMTYTKYMDLHLCCFIPGKIIDEVLRVLNLIESTTKPLRAFEVLQELRDISSMAIEHFDEKLAHLLKKSVIELTTQNIRGVGSSTSASGSSPSTGSPRMVVCGDQGRHYVFGVASNLDDTVIVQGSSGHISPIQSPQIHRGYGTTFRCNEAAINRILIKKMELKYNGAIKKFNRMIHIQNKQAKQLRENAVTMSEMSAQIVELKRRIEIVKTNRNVEIPSEQQHRSNINISGNKLNMPNIGDEKAKPRTATLILKRRIIENIGSKSKNNIGSSSSEDKCKIPKLE